MPKSKNRLIIGLLLNSLDGAYQEAVWKGVVKEAKKQDISIIIFTGKPLNSPIGEEAYHNSIYYTIPKEKLDGIIIASGALSNYTDLTKFEQFLSTYSDIPLISLGQKLPGIPSIDYNNFESMKQIVDHIIEVHNIKDIAFLKGPHNNIEAETRYQAFRESMEQHNIPIQDELIVDGFLDSTSGYNAIETLLDTRKAKFRALICANDEMAVGAYMELRNRGLKVPDDIILTGYDDSQDLRYIPGNITITTVKQPIFEMGQLAVQMVKDLINNKLQSTDIMLPCEPHYRKSCGCITEEDNLETTVEVLRAELVKKQSMQYVMQNMRLITTAISGIEEMSSLKDVVYLQFPKLGFESYYLSLFQNSETFYPGDTFHTPQFSKLTVAYDSSGDLLNNSELTYPTKGFLPPEVLDYNKQFVLMVHPLFSNETQYGSMITSLHGNETIIYSSIREHVSSAIKTICLYDERQQAEIKLKFTLEKLKNSEENFKKMAYLLPSLIFETDNELNISFMNKETLKIFGLSDGDTANKSLINFLDSESLSKVIKYCQKVMYSGSSSFLEIKINTANNSQTIILAKASLIIDDNRVKGYRWSAINVKSMLNSVTQSKDLFFNKFDLTNREKEILSLLLEGNKNRMISQKLFIAESTVKGHLRAIYAKMNIKNRQDLYMMLEESQKNNLGADSFLFSMISKLMNS